jgi:hypothetical protein
LRSKRPPRRPKGYPHLLTICGETWHLIFVRKLPDGDLGYCTDDMRLIVISLAQTKAELRATIRHEYLHAMEAELKIKLGHPKIRKLEYAISEVEAQLPED